MPRPDPDQPLPVVKLSVDWEQENTIWFMYRDPYDDGFFLTYTVSDRTFRASFYIRSPDGDVTMRHSEASAEQCAQLRAMLTPEQVAMCVNASLRWAG